MYGEQERGPESGGATCAEAHGQTEEQQDDRHVEKYVGGVIDLLALTLELCISHERQHHKRTVVGLEGTQFTVNLKVTPSEDTRGIGKL